MTDGTDGRARAGASDGDGTPGRDAGRPPPPRTGPPGWAPPPPPPGWAPPPPGWAPPPPGWAGRPPSTEIDATLKARDVPLDRQLGMGAAPATRPAAWLWLLFAALGFLGGQIVATIFVLVSAAVTGKVGSLNAVSHLSEPPTWYVVSTLLGLWTGFFGGPWLASSVRGTRSLVRDVGLRFRAIDLVGIPIGIGGQFVVAAMYVPIAQHVHDFNQKFDAPSQKLTGGSHGLGFALIAVLTVLGAPFFEELFFRGVILRSLARLFGSIGRWVGPALAIVVTGVLFGLAHAESLQLLGLATFGIILSFVAFRTGRLGMGMVAHATFNLVAVVATLAAGTGVLF